MFKERKNLNDGYWGSGIYKEAIRKKNFKKEILKNLQHERKQEEEKTCNKINDPNCYKTTGGKKGGSVTTGKNCGTT